MKLLYVGESWQGSNARSVREAIAGLPGVLLQEIDEDHFLPRYVGLPLRLANRVLLPLQRYELATALCKAVSSFVPDAVVVYKGRGIGAALVESVRDAGVAAVNIFPDSSPHAHGPTLKEAVGRYDLVISTKPFHPPIWQSMYGYDNKCVCVPHGYDPNVHYWREAAPADKYDVAMCATWRPEYHDLVLEFARELSGDIVSVALAGSGWDRRLGDLPSHWRVFGALSGPSYGSFLRGAKIVIAPVNRQVVINGVRQPGDEDTARSYELAAAHCFFVHQRTNFLQAVYDEATEVPMWRDARELAAQVRRWLPDREGRLALAARAHARAVPAYSVSARAKLVLGHIEGLLRAPK